MSTVTYLIGVIPGEVKLHLKDNAVPVVNPPRRIPEALKSRLKCELGVIPGEVKLHLKDNAVPVVNPPRRIPETLKSRLKYELDTMENDQNIVKVDEPTDWVNSLVVVEKPQTGKLRICLDPKALNEAIRRPHYPMYTLDDVMCKLTKATCFSLLDIRMRTGAFNWMKVRHI